MIAESNISCQKTKIGCQMEIDWHYGTVSGNGHSYTALYQHYNDVFSTSDGAFSKGTADFGFYLGCPQYADRADPDYTTVKQVVNEFFR